MSNLNKSQLRLSFFPVPLNVFSNDLISWGSVGVLALAAKSSVMFYKATPGCFSYLRSLEMPDQADPVILAFHGESPVLAIADSLRRVHLFDCVTAQFVGRTRQLLDPTCFVDMKWCDDILVCLLSSNHVVAVDFWSNEVDEGAVHSRVLWRIDVAQKMDRLVVDENSSFRLMLLEKRNRGIMILESGSAKQPPRPPFVTQGLSGNECLVDACFHPHFKDMVMLLFEGVMVVMGLKSRELKTVISESNPAFWRVIPSYNDHRLVTVQTTDNAFITYRMVDGKFEFERVGGCLYRRDALGKQYPAMVAFNKHFREYFISVTPTCGLLMMKMVRNNPVAIRRGPVQPRRVTCFDFLDGVSLFGLLSGDIMFVRNSDGCVLNMFNVSRDPVLEVHFFNTRKILWITKTVSGTIDLEQKEVVTIDSRAGPPNAASVSEKIAVTRRGKFTVGLLRVDESSETNVAFDDEIIALTTQWKRTSATIERMKDDGPCYVVLLRNRQLHFFAGKGQKPRLILRCSDDLTRPVSVSWKMSLLTTADISGRLLFYDFDCNESKMVVCPFGNIKNVEFERNGTGLFVHSHDNKLAYYSQQFDLCKTLVANFSMTGGGMVMIQSPDGSVSLMMIREWTPLVRIAQASLLVVVKSEEERILNVLDQARDFDSAISAACENGLFFMETLLRVAKRYIDGGSLPLQYSNYGGSEEATESYRVQSLFLKGAINNTHSLYYGLFLRTMLNDLEGAKNAILDYSDSKELFPIFALAAALLGAELNATSVGILKATAISMIENRDYYSGCALLCVAGAHKIAVEQLQDKGMWDTSIAMLKVLPSSPITKRLLRRAAHQYLDDGLDRKSLMTFASIGDFHAVLAILSLRKDKLIAYVFLKLLEGSQHLTEYDGDMTPFVHHFSSLDTVEALIKDKFKRITNLT